MATVTKKELIDRIAERTQAKRVSVKRIVQAFLDEIVKELCQDNRLEFRDFGVFETRTRASRTAQNPKTLERVEVPTKRTVKFKMGRLMRENLIASAARRHRPSRACESDGRLGRTGPAGREAGLSGRSSKRSLKCWKERSSGSTPGRGTGSSGPTDGRDVFVHYSSIAGDGFKTWTKENGSCSTLSRVRRGSGPPT